MYNRDDVVLLVVNVFQDSDHTNPDRYIFFRDLKFGKSVDTTGTAAIGTLPMLTLLTGLL